MLSKLLDVVNADANEPDWDEIYLLTRYNRNGIESLIDLARALWLETNDPDEYDALVAAL